jgi:hypothetical protein
MESGTMAAKLGVSKAAAGKSGISMKKTLSMRKMVD